MVAGRSTRVEIAFTPWPSGSGTRGATHLWELGTFFVNMGSYLTFIFSVLNETVIQAQGGMCLVA